jgi:FtsH-binding integral membrane protein
MSEFDKIDGDGNGYIDEKEFNAYKAELELEDQRRRIEDEDNQRDAIRKMAWFALIGLLVYPLGIFAAEFFGMQKAAELISDIAPTYFASIAVLVSAFFGTSALKKDK